MFNRPARLPKNRSSARAGTNNESRAKFGVWLEKSCEQPFPAFFMFQPLLN
jgi:hypothetical protein